jgi:hypothetical protein
MQKTKKGLLLQRRTIRTALIAVCALQAALAQTNSSTPALSAHPDWIQIPGMLIRPDCVHEIPNGATVLSQGDMLTGDVRLNGVSIAHYDPCPEAPVITRHIGSSDSNPPGAGNGWVEAVQKNLSLGSGDNIDLMSGSWTVPANPATSGALIYLWNGIEPTSQNWVLQPVLQWGNNGGFGGDYWVISTWLVGPNYVYHGAAVTVYPGDPIVGQTIMVGESGGNTSFLVQAIDELHAGISMISVTTAGLQWTWAYAGVLEVYALSTCSQLPAGDNATFTGSTVDHGFPSSVPDSTAWYGASYPYGGPSCNYWPTTNGSTAYLFWNFPRLRPIL